LFGQGAGLIDSIKSVKEVAQDIVTEAEAFSEITDHRSLKKGTRKIPTGTSVPLDLPSQWVTPNLIQIFRTAIARAIEWAREIGLKASGL